MRHDYEEEDVQEILKRAVRTDAQRQTGRENLVMSARELGISDEALAEAELDYLREKTETGELREFIAEHRRSFFEHLASYVIVNTFLLILNLLNWNGHLWAIYPILGWGIGIAFHATEAYGRGDNFRREFARWKRRRSGGGSSSEEDDEDDEGVQFRRGVMIGVGGSRRRRRRKDREV